MSRSARKALLVSLVVLVIALFGFGVWWSLRSAPVDHSNAAVEAPQNLGAPVTSAPQITPPPTLQVDDAPAYTSLDTTVVYPLEVALELVRAKDTPHADGAPPLGSGANAKLSGQIQGTNGQGVRAEIHFIAGANEGRVLYGDRLGHFGANDLYPGLTIVQVSGPGIPGSMREVRLRQERDQLLNITYARPAAVHAQVIGPDGKGIAGAKVQLDGQVATSDEDGELFYSAVASGEALAVVEKPGFAAYRENVMLSAAQVVEKGRIKFALQPGARVVIEIVEAINSGEQALVYILPELPDAQRKFPWQTVNPVHVWPGGSAIAYDLPAGRLQLRLFHGGAIAKPPTRSIELSPGESEVVQFHLEPAPVVSGIVTDHGEPVEGAHVRLEVPDRTHAMLAALGQENYLSLEKEVYPDLPSAVQEVPTTSRGQYSLSANEDVSRVRYLTAISPDGKRIAHAVLKGGETRADLALGPVEKGSAVLVVQMEGRIQPLPVITTVEGVAREEVLVPPGRDLHVEDLPRGSWLLSVSWNGQTILKRQPIELSDEVSVPIVLPEGAVMGQDAETRKRAGKK